LTLILTLNILTAFIRLGRAGPVRGRVPSIFIIICIVPSIDYFKVENDYKTWNPKNSSETSK
jgi:hypothetical protein